jgi:hypothetical protein
MDGVFPNGNIRSERRQAAECISNLLIFLDLDQDGGRPQGSVAGGFDPHRNSEASAPAQVKAKLCADAPSPGDGQHA